MGFATQAQKEVSEEERPGDTEDAEATEGDRQAVDAKQGGSRTEPMPIGVDTASNGTTWDAAEYTPANRATGSKQPSTGIGLRRT